MHPDAVAAGAGRRAQDYKVNAMRALLAAAVAVLTQALQPTVLVTDGLAPCGLERLAERGAKIEDLNERSLQDALQEADGVIVRSATTLTATLIEQAPSLRCIGRAGVGLDNIDLEAAAKRKIPVVTSAGASTRAVSELCMAHLLQCARGLIQADRAVSSGAFKAFKGSAASTAHELGGKRLGLLGFGRIALTQRLFLKFSELQVRVDGVSATRCRRGAVDVAVRESTRLVREPRPCRDAVVRHRSRSLVWMVRATSRPVPTPKLYVDPSRPSKRARPWW